MQGLVTNLAPAMNAADAATQASNSLNSASNGVSSDQKGFSPLFSNMLSSAQQSDQVQFKSQFINAFGGQGLPLEGQFLPPAVMSGLTARNPNSLLNGDEQKNLSAQRLLETDGELLGDIDAAAQTPVTPSVVIDNAVRAQGLPGQQAGTGAVASQLAGQGQNKLQQDLMMQQLAVAPAEVVEDGLAGLRLTPQLENAPVLNNGAQLSNMLRDAMLLKQPANSGAESKIGDSFNSAIGNLAALSTEAKGGSETRSLMQASINTPFAQQGNWGQEVGSRVKWMVNSQIQSAELKMNPAHLGPVEVKISVQNDQAIIHFSAQNGAVREALDSAMPRLREMLGDNGVNLADVDVSDQSFAQQQQASEEERDAMGGEFGSDDGLDDDSCGRNTAEHEEGEIVLSSRVVDYYA